MSLNRWIGVGRLTKDVDLRYTQNNGKAVGNFTIAVNRAFKNKQTGEYDADFINCVIWGRAAENLANYMKKGSQIGVDGRIQTRNYKNKNGDRVFVTEVVAENVQFLELKNKNAVSQKANQHVEEKNQFAEDAQPIDIDDNDLPF